MVATWALVHPAVPPQPEIRYVIIHMPGPAWEKGVPPLEQKGLQEHVSHYAQLLTDGKLSLGGPFMDEVSGGMMIPEPGVSESEIRAFAQSDPAVKSGLLTYHIRPWMSALHK